MRLTICWMMSFFRMISIMSTSDVFILWRRPSASTSSVLMEMYLLLMTDGKKYLWKFNYQKRVSSSWRRMLPGSQLERSNFIVFFQSSRIHMKTLFRKYSIIFLSRYSVDTLQSYQIITLLYISLTSMIQALSLSLKILNYMASFILLIQFRRKRNKSNICLGILRIHPTLNMWLLLSVSFWIRLSYSHTAPTLSGPYISGSNFLVKRLLMDDEK